MEDPDSSFLVQQVCRKRKGRVMTGDFAITVTRSLHLECQEQKLMERERSEGKGRDEDGLKGEGRVEGGRGREGRERKKRAVNKRGMVRGPNASSGRQVRAITLWKTSHTLFPMVNSKDTSSFEYLVMLQFSSRNCKRPEMPSQRSRLRQPWYQTVPSLTHENHNANANSQSSCTI